MRFIEQIKQLRKKRQMPQKQFAAASEVKMVIYCKIEKGERRTLIRLKQIRMNCCSIACRTSHSTNIINRKSVEYFKTEYK
jgi:transcriptional regulator with XRE-family HTH domain